MKYEGMVETNGPNPLLVQKRELGPKVPQQMIERAGTELCVMPAKARGAGEVSGLGGGQAQSIQNNKTTAFTA